MTQRIVLSIKSKTEQHGRLTCTIQIGTIRNYDWFRTFYVHTSGKRLKVTRFLLPKRAQQSCWNCLKEEIFSSIYSYVNISEPDVLCRSRAKMNLCFLFIPAVRTVVKYTNWRAFVVLPSAVIVAKSSASWRVLYSNRAYNYSTFCFKL